MEVFVAVCSVQYSPLRDLLHNFSHFIHPLGFWSVVTQQHQCTEIREFCQPEKNIITLPVRTLKSLISTVEIPAVSPS